MHEKKIIIDNKRNEDMNNNDMVIIQEVLKELSPYIIGHGGNITLESYDGKEVVVKLHGACTSCPMSFLTLQEGILKALQKKLSAIQSVRALQDDE